MPTTSSESSKPKRNLSATARAHSTPAMMPIAIAPSGVTKPHAGVMATRPATAPEAAPSVVGFPSRTCSTTSQPSTAPEVATIVLVKATPARSPAVSAEPALNPNHPNHSSDAPRRTNGRLCGRMGSRGQPRRLPRTIASASPAAPALMCTAVPPAKSRAPSLLTFAIQPPTASAPTKPSNENTQCATGK